MHGKTIVLMGFEGSGRRNLISKVMKDGILKDALVEFPSWTTSRQLGGEKCVVISNEKFERDLTAGNLFGDGSTEDGLIRIAAHQFQYTEAMMQKSFPIVALDLERAKKFKEAFPNNVIIFYVRADSDSLRRRTRGKRAIVGNDYLDFVKRDQEMIAFADDTIENSDGPDLSEELEAKLINLTIASPNDPASPFFGF